MEKRISPGLRADEMSFEVLNNIPLGAFILREDLAITFWNTCMELWTGMPRASMIGKKVTAVYPHLANAKYRGRLEGVFISKTPAVFSSLLHKYFIPILQKNGEFRAQLTTVTPMPNKDGKTLALVTIQDVTELNDRLRAFRDMRDKAIKEVQDRKRLEERLRYDAAHDLLTNLLNHHNFVDALDSASSLAKRHAYPLSVCLWDVDYFKKVNDTYGHQVGDIVLVKFSEIIKSIIRHEDPAGRYGGEEFCVVLQHTEINGAVQCMERILETLRSTVFTSMDGVEFHVTATCGVVEINTELNDPSKLLRAADMAMYHGKRSGRNRIVTYTPELG
jgi:diguanylate cyclase (GGDEF)-like protein/PAS domain S-box-containing protein